MAEASEKKAIDESEFSHYALQWALDNLGDTIKDSLLIILSVQPVADYGFAFASTYGAAHTSGTDCIYGGEPEEILFSAFWRKLRISAENMGVFLGSVSNYCSHNAKCPVLVVKK